MQQASINALSDPNSVVISTLKENDAFSGWVPEMPLVMFHHMNDDVVPYDNAVEALDGFVEAGAQYVGLVPYSVSLGTVDTIHYATAPFAYMLGTTWLDFIAKEDQSAKLGSFSGME